MGEDRLAPRGMPLVVPQSLFDRIKSDPEFAEACARGKIIPNAPLPLRITP